MFTFVKVVCKLIKMKLRHIVIISGVVLVFALIIVALKLGMSKEVVEVEKSTYLPTLKGELIQNKNETFAIEGFGTLASYNNVDVAAEVQGKLLKGKIELKPGTKFSKGDLLFSIYSAEAKLSLKARKSSFITLLANILPGVVVTNYVTAIIVAAVISLLNMFVRPLLVFFTLPATIVTLGLFLFVINAVIILFASNLVGGFVVSGFFTALLFSILLSVFRSFLFSLLDEEKKA